jgi:hypothetical protein
VIARHDNVRHVFFGHPSSDFRQLARHLLLLAARDANGLPFGQDAGDPALFSCHGDLRLHRRRRGQIIINDVDLMEGLPSRGVDQQRDAYAAEQDELVSVGFLRFQGLSVHIRL